MFEKFRFQTVCTKKSSHIYSVRVASKDEEHDEGYDGQHDDQDPAEEAAVRVRTVHRKVVQGCAAAVWRAHP